MVDSIYIMSEPSFINITERAYKYIRQFTIKSIDDALVELITNCNDAYNKSIQSSTKIIEIDILSESKIAVRDFALGLTAEQLESCFLQIGNYTANDNSRGFFSRGAKDISALGNITFNAIKNNLYSSCELNTDAYGMVAVSNVEATEELRAKIKIPYPNNGLEVIIDLLPNFSNLNVNDIYFSLSHLAILRDIVTNTDINILLRKYDNDSVTYENRIVYEYPPAKLILDVTYNIPNYEDEQAQLVIYCTDKPLPQPIKESYLEFGFLIKDNTSIYEVNTLDDRFRWSPNINYVYGYIKSNAIKKYLIDFDINGPSVKNPYPIIDPSRLTGVNKQHPLIINLYSLPLVRIDFILRELNSKIATQSVNIEDINDLLSELGNYGLDLVKNENVSLKYTSNYDTQLVKTIVDDRQKYVTYENNYSMPSDYHYTQNSTDRYIEDQIKKIEVKDDGSLVYPGYNYIVTPTYDVIQIPDSNIIQQQICVPEQFLNGENNIYLQMHPYIYRLSENGELLKMYVFSKGIIEKPITEDEKHVPEKMQQITIQFINDINNQNRYNVDNTNGITIKLNINNPIVNKHFIKQNNLNSISLDTMTSTKTLIFFKELITDIFSTIIVESDIENNKFVLESNNHLLNIKKANEYYNSIVAKIESPIYDIINKYITKNETQQLNTFNDIISKVNYELSNVLNTTSVSDIKQITDKINSAVENIIK
jgi:hypothetical protein